MKILIIGSEGFIGSNLVKLYLEKGWDVSGADIVEYPKQVYKYSRISRLSPGYEDLFFDYQVDYCINAAGNGSVPFSVEHPVKDFEANVLDTIKLLDAIRKYSPACKYLHISSAAVYGNPVKLPVVETQSCQPVSPYGWHKLASEELCSQFYTIYGISTLVIRPFSVFGPGLRKQLIWDLYQKMKKSDTIELFGTGEETRDFIYINDLVHAVEVLLLKGLFKAERYNIATGEEVSINRLSSFFGSYFPEKKVIRFNQQVRKGDPLNWKADISKLQQLGFSPKVTLEQGLKETFDWLEHAL